MKLERTIKENGKDIVLRREWINLETGSLFILGSKTNHSCFYSDCSSSDAHPEGNWQHSIPEISEPVDIRISLTWRKINM